MLHILALSLFLTGGVSPNAAPDPAAHVVAAEALPDGNAVGQSPAKGDQPEGESGAGAKRRRSNPGEPRSRRWDPGGAYLEVHRLDQGQPSSPHGETGRRFQAASYLRGRG